MDLVDLTRVPEGWRMRSVEDVCQKVTSGGTPSRKVPEFYTAGVWPWVKTQELRDGWIDDTEERITNEAVVKSSAKVLPAHTVLMAMYGATVGQLGILREPMTCNQACSALIVDPDEADYRFVYYSLLASRNSIKGLAVGAAQQNLSGQAIKNMRLPFPPLNEQRRIAHILGTLDDKIDLNRRMNETLEEMARALFKSWFVDFDPVRAKSEGRDTGLPKRLTDLFPDRFVDSDFGKTPAGWDYVSVNEEFRVTIGRTPPRKEAQWFSYADSDVPWVSIRDMGLSGVYLHDVAEYLTHDAVTTHKVELVPQGTVLLSFKLTVGRVAIASRALATNEAIAHFHPRRSDSPGALFLYSYLRNFDYSSLGNTSSIATAVNSKSVREMPLLRPPAGLVRAFETLLRPYFEKVRAVDREVANLKETRNVLLRDLLSRPSVAHSHTPGDANAGLTDGT